jgi:hypothetical protein
MMGDRRQAVRQFPIDARVVLARENAAGDQRGIGLLASVAAGYEIDFNCYFYRYARPRQEVMRRLSHRLRVRGALAPALRKPGVS